jgi:hypothetical protein
MSTLSTACIGLPCISISIIYEHLFYILFLKVNIYLALADETRINQKVDGVRTGADASQSARRDELCALDGAQRAVYPQIFIQCAGLPTTVVGDFDRFEEAVDHRAAE